MIKPVYELILLLRKGSARRQVFSQREQMDLVTLRELLRLRDDRLHICLELGVIQRGIDITESPTGRSL